MNIPSIIECDFQKIEIVFLDADNTLWKTAPDEFISRISSELVLIDKYTVMRSADGATFTLTKEIPRLLHALHGRGVRFGLVSDNRKVMIWKALKLFGITKYFNKKLVHVRLYKGYCPKVKLILAMLLGLKKQESGFSSRKVLFVDDKDYSQEAHGARVLFVRVEDAEETPELLQLVLKIKSKKQKQHLHC